MARDRPKVVRLAIGARVGSVGAKVLGQTLDSARSLVAAEGVRRRRILVNEPAEGRRRQVPVVGAECEGLAQGVHGIAGGDRSREAGQLGVAPDAVQRCILPAEVVAAAERVEAPS